MPYLPLATNSAPDRSLYAPIGSAGPGIVSTFSTATISSLIADSAIFSTVAVTGSIVADTAAFSTVSTSSLYADYISSGTAFIHDAECSTIVAQTLQLDAQVLTADTNDLFLNGIPIATTANLSSIADWSIYAAVSTIQVENYDIKDWGAASGSTLTVSSMNAGNAEISSLTVSSIVGDTISTQSLQANSIVCGDISTITLTVQSTIHVISTISSQVIEAPLINCSTIVASDLMATSSITVSTINGAIFPSPPASTISTFTDASISSLAVSTINGAIFPSPPASTMSTFTDASISSLAVSSINGSPFSSLLTSNWSQFAANSDVNMNGYSITSPGKNLGVTVGSNLSIGAGSNISFNTNNEINLNSGNYIQTCRFGSITVDKNTNIFDYSQLNITAQNGNRGQLILTANSGYGNGIGGEVSITANGGSLVGSVGQGGKINIVANTGGGLFSNVPSVVNIGAGGINIYSGAVPSFVAYPGYNFIFGNTGNSICAGVPPFTPTFPGTTFLYGAAGVTVGSALYANDVYPYTDGSSSNDLIIRGRTGPTAKTQILDCRQVAFVSGQGVLTEVSSINGNPYPPPAADQVSSFSTFFISSLTVNNISTSRVYVSSLQTNTGSMQIGLNDETGITIANNENGQTITLDQYNGDITLTTANALKMNATTYINGSLYTSTVNLSTINGQPYPPASGGSVSTFSTFAISSLKANNVSSPLVVVSTVALDADTYIQMKDVDSLMVINNGGGEILLGNAAFDTAFVRVNAILDAPVEVRASTITVSSINGQAYPPPAGGSISTFSTFAISSLTAGTINTNTISTGSIAGSGGSLTLGPVISLAPSTNGTNGVVQVVGGSLNLTTGGTAIYAPSISTIAFTAVNGGMSTLAVSSLTDINDATATRITAAAMSSLVISTGNIYCNFISTVGGIRSLAGITANGAIIATGGISTGTNLFAGTFYRGPGVSTTSISSASMVTSTINGRLVPFVQYGTSTFQAAAFNIQISPYSTTAYATQISPTAPTVQAPHISTVNISTIQVHAGAGSAGIGFSWLTLGTNY